MQLQSLFSTVVSSLFAADVLSTGGDTLSWKVLRSRIKHSGWSDSDPIGGSESKSPLKVGHFVSAAEARVSFLSLKAVFWLKF